MNGVMISTIQPAMDKNALATPLPFWLFCYECGVTEYKLRGNALQASILALCTGGHGLGRIGVLSVLRDRAPSYRRAAHAASTTRRKRKARSLPTSRPRSARAMTSSSSCSSSPSGSACSSLPPSPSPRATRRSECELPLYRPQRHCNAVARLLQADLWQHGNT
jgi:hypothetical protein